MQNNNGILWVSGGINRNIVECKYYRCFFRPENRWKVLIETLWNVNHYVGIYVPEANEY